MFDRVLNTPLTPYVILQLIKVNFSPIFVYHGICQEKDSMAFSFLGILELYTRKVSKMFIYKHAETIEYIKNWHTF